MTSVPDAWTEFCLISVMNEQGEVAFAAMTEDITAMDFGEKDIEGVPLLNGGRVVRNVPMTDESVTLKVYPVKADHADGGVVQFFHPTAIPDTSQPMLVVNDKDRLPCRVVLLWSTRLPASATAIPGSGEPAYRIQSINAYMTRYVPSFDGKIVSAEVTFKWAPFSKDGTDNKREESTDGSAQFVDTASSSPTSWT